MIHFFNSSVNLNKSSDLCLYQRPGQRTQWSGRTQTAWWSVTSERGRPARETHMLDLISPPLLSVLSYSSAVITVMLSPPRPTSSIEAMVLVSNCVRHSLPCESLHFIGLIFSFFFQSCSRSRLWTYVNPCRWKWCFCSVQRHEGGTTQSGGWKPALPHWSHDLQVEFIYMNQLNMRNTIFYKL